MRLHPVHLHCEVIEVVDLTVAVGVDVATVRCEPRRAHLTDPGEIQLRLTFPCDVVARRTIQPGRFQSCIQNVLIHCLLIDVVADAVVVCITRPYRARRHAQRNGKQAQQPCVEVDQEAA